MAEVIHFEYRRPGKGVVTYEELLVLDRPDVKVLLQERYDGNDINVEGSCILNSGAPIIWYVFPESWHSVGRFHLREGTLTGWYTNLCKPIEFHDDTWIGNDLFLDLWQPVDGHPVWLDEDEFDHATKTRLLDGATVKRVQNERTLIEFQLGQHSWPPPVAMDIDLNHVRSLLELS